MRALIVGAGIAGPVTAMALQQVGIEPVIVEAHARGDAEVGSYLTVTPNGLDALAAVDALDAATAIGSPTRRNVMRDDAWRVLGDLPLGTPLADGTPALTLKRSRLARGWPTSRSSAASASSRDAGWSAAERAGESVVATFDDGSTETADLLIGADGVHSIVRRLIDPGAPAGRYVGLTNFGGLTPAAACRPGCRDRARDVAVRLRSPGVLRGAPAAERRHRLVRQRATARDHGRRAGPHDARQWQAWLASLFTEDGGPAVALIEAGHLELAADNTYDLGRVPVWHRDRMLVIGDAAHAPAPSSGQGASMAMEDGVALAAALRDAPSIEAGFAAFEAARRERVEKIVAYGARSSSSKTPGRIGRAFQGVLMRILFRWVITDRSLAWMYDHRTPRPLAE